MKREFLIERQGKQFVLYAGLLDELHPRIRAIRTQLVQIPDPANGEVAVAKAAIELDDGTTFEGIGDASSANVGRNIAPHIIRMAETRAKARAMRDALNVGAAALEELADDDEPPPVTQGAPAGPGAGGRPPIPQDAEPEARGHQPAPGTSTPADRPPAAAAPDPAGVARFDLEAKGDALEREYHRAKQLALQLGVRVAKNDPPRGGDAMRRALASVAAAVEQRQRQTQLAAS